jgi:hypothetical protein
MPREKQISNLLSTRFPTYQSIVRTWENPYFWDDYTWNATIGDTFSWECSNITTWEETLWFGRTPIWIFSEGTIAAVRSIPCPPWHLYPLIIIEKSLPTSFFLK